MLKVEDLQINYGNHVVLDGLAAQFSRGIVTGIVGANGSGKTTLFKALCCLVSASSGQISLDNIQVDMNDPTWKAQIALIADSNTLFSDLTVTEHFELVRMLHGLSRNDASARRNHLQRIFDLEGHSQHMASTLSFGFQKRLAIALALFRVAEVYLFDEPFTGLDAGSLGMFKSVVRAIAASGRVVLIASHIAPLIQEMCEDICRLVAGRLHPVDMQREDFGFPDSPSSPLEIPWLRLADT